MHKELIAFRLFQPPHRQPIVSAKCCQILPAKPSDCGRWVAVFTAVAGWPFSLRSLGWPFNPHSPICPLALRPFRQAPATADLRQGKQTQELRQAQDLTTIRPSTSSGQAFRNRAVPEFAPQTSTRTGKNASIPPFEVAGPVQGALSDFFRPKRVSTSRIVEMKIVPSLSTE